MNSHHDAAGIVWSATNVRTQENVPPRPLEEIDGELKFVGREIQEMLKEVVG